MINKLKELPKIIKDQRSELLNLQKVYDDSSLTMTKWEITEAQNIANETDDNGKPLFSNAEKRQIELKKRKSNDELMTKIDSNLKELKCRIDELRIEMQFNIDTQENLRAIARLGGDSE